MSTNSPDYREKYPGLDEIDYWSLNDPKIGIFFYSIVAQLPEELKIKLMTQEAKSAFCLNIHYAYDKNPDWGEDYIMQQLVRIKRGALLDDSQFEIFIQAVEKVCGIKFVDTSKNNGIQLLLGKAKNKIKNIETPEKI